MRKRANITEGQKLALQDVELLSQAAQADDRAQVSLRKIFCEGTRPRGQVIPWKDGPLVKGNGASGNVKVAPFTAFISPDGATSGEGTENASGGDALTELLSGFYAGGTASISIAPTSGYMRWDLLYAVVSEIATDLGTRLVKDGATGVNTATSVNTTKTINVSLAWVQGSEVATGAGSYPDASLPAVPTPAAGTSHVPLALVRVQYSAAMGSVAYTKNDIAQAYSVARINPQNGTPSVCVAGVSGKADAGSGAGFSADPRGQIGGTTASGGWPLTGNRDERVIEPGAGSIEAWIKIGPFKGTATKTFGTSITVISEPIAKFGHFSDQYRDAVPHDWRNRFFVAQWFWNATGTMGFADVTGATGTLVPSVSPAKISNTAQNITQNQFMSWGQSFADDGVIAGYRVVGKCIVGDITTSNDELYLLVSTTTGYLHLGAKAAASGGSDYVNGGRGFVLLKASPMGLDV
jgi:hypothetical protein